MVQWVKDLVFPVLCCGCSCGLDSVPSLGTSYVVSAAKKKKVIPPPPPTVASSGIIKPVSLSKDTYRAPMSQFT